MNYLREVHSHPPRNTQGDGSVIAAGDVVIAHDEQLPHGQWKLGVVQEVLTGRDGVSLAAIVKVAANDWQ